MVSSTRPPSASERICLRKLDGLSIRWPIPLSTNIVDVAAFLRHDRARCIDKQRQLFDQGFTDDARTWLADHHVCGIHQKRHLILEAKDPAGESVRAAPTAGSWLVDRHCAHSRSAPAKGSREATVCSVSVSKLRIPTPPT